MTRYASVWDALKDTPQEAAKMRLRSETMLLVRTAVQGWEMTQRAAAAKLGVTQPRLNELLTGKLSRFSLDALVDLASAAGIELDITRRMTGKTSSKPRRPARASAAHEPMHA